MSEDTGYNDDKFKRRNDWFQTWSGRVLTVLEPDVMDISITDIAHALARICRYGGHIDGFYSVAQHSLLVCELVEKEDEQYAMDGLLHDAAEAYIGDCIRPLKNQLSKYRAIEHAWEDVIGRRFALADGMAGTHIEAVKIADERIMATEKRDLFSGNRVWSFDVHPIAERIVPWWHITAEEMFLQKFFKLREKGRVW